jgi:putative transposase
VPQRRRRKRLGTSTTAALPVADAPNKVWAVDFHLDATTDGRPVKIASVLDEHTRECLGVLVARSVTSEDLTDELDRLAAERGYPGRAALRNGAELACAASRQGRRTGRAVVHPARRAVAQRLRRVVQQPPARRVPEHQHLLVPGPAQVVITDWNQDYNHRRRHTSLSYQAPAVYAATYTHR